MQNFILTLTTAIVLIGTHAQAITQCPNGAIGKDLKQELEKEGFKLYNTDGFKPKSEYSFARVAIATSKDNHSRLSCDYHADSWFYGHELEVGNCQPKDKSKWDTYTDGTIYCEADEATSCEFSCANQQ